MLIDYEPNKMFELMFKRIQYKYLEEKDITLIETILIIVVQIR